MTRIKPNNKENIVNEKPMDSSVLVLTERELKSCVFNLFTQVTV